jgi:hypothetical protein
MAIPVVAAILAPLRETRLGNNPEIVDGLLLAAGVVEGFAVAGLQQGAKSMRSELRLWLKRDRSILSLPLHLQHSNVIGLSELPRSGRDLVCRRAFLHHLVHALKAKKPPVRVLGLGYAV